MDGRTRCLRLWVNTSLQNRLTTKLLGSGLISVARLLRKLNLRQRTESGDGGQFAYHDAQLDLFLVFRWDGAGLTDSGRIVLLEQEVPGFQPLHIQGHLNRLLFMIRSGEAIEKLVWIVPHARHRDLDMIVFPWVRMWEAGFGDRFPAIEYRDENGSYLGSLGKSRNGRRRTRPATSKYVRFPGRLVIPK